jgi:hypothetical protein
MACPHFSVFLSLNRSLAKLLKSEFAFVHTAEPGLVFEDHWE